MSISHIFLDIHIWTPFVDIGGLSADLMGVNISIVLENMHGFYAPSAISGAVTTHSIS